MKPPQWLYDIRHPLLAPLWTPEGYRWFHVGHRALLWLVGRILCRWELWENRHGLRRMKEQADALDDMNRALERVRKAFEP